MRFEVAGTEFRSQNPGARRDAKTKSKFTGINGIKGIRGDISACERMSVKGEKAGDLMADAPTHYACTMIHVFPYPFHPLHPC